MSSISQQLDIEKDRKGDVTIFRFTGRLDHTQTSKVQNGLMGIVEENAQNVLLNFSGIDYISSAGLRLVLSMEEKVKSGGGKLVICVTKGPVTDLLNLIGLTTRLKLFDNEENALKSY